MNTPKARVEGYTTTPSGTRIATKTLVEEMRRFRGRLSRPSLCRAMGWPATPQNLSFVYKLCMRWQIVTPDYVPEINPKPFALARDIRRDAAYELAAQNRIEQIRLARAEMASASPYKPGPLIWEDIR